MLCSTSKALARVNTPHGYTVYIYVLFRIERDELYIYIYIHIPMVEKVYIDKCSDDMCIPNKYHGLAVSVSVSHESASHVFLQD